MNAFFFLNTKGCLVHALKICVLLFENMCGNTCGEKVYGNTYNVV